MVTRFLCLVCFLFLLTRYSAVLEACCLLQDLAELPYGDMTEVCSLFGFRFLCQFQAITAASFDFPNATKHSFVF